MVTIVVIGILIGATVGLRFNAWIVMAVVGLALVGITSAGVVHGDQIWSMILTIILVGTALQVGYVVGIIIRFIIITFSESVRGLYQGLHNLRDMRRMEASLRKARALRLRFSRSLASRRQRLG
jgi:hypothetical protein